MKQQQIKAKVNGVEQTTNFNTTKSADLLWKSVDDCLPPIDKEVVVLAYNIDIEHYKVLFAHRVNPKGDGVGYDEGGWNLPNVVWWLDLELPI